MKKLMLLLICAVMMLSMSATVFASDSPNIEINTKDGYRYYDDELEAYVTAFTINANGSVNYLTEEEVTAIPSVGDVDESTELIIHDQERRDSEIKPYDYREWYVFKQTGGPYHYKGSEKKVSADLEAPEGGGGIEKAVSYTSRHFFSASVNTTSKKSAVQAGATIGWETSATNSTVYKVNLLPEQTGYIGFYPYYNRVVGDLELHTNWDGLISTVRGVSGYSVKLTDDGEADGLYKFIEN